MLCMRAKCFFDSKNCTPSENMTRNIFFFDDRPGGPGGKKLAFLNAYTP